MHTIKVLPFSRTIYISKIYKSESIILTKHQKIRFKEAPNNTDRVYSRSHAVGEAISILIKQSKKEQNS